MSITVLAQVYDETRRLAIAGSAVAVGDFRLKKLLAPLEKAGEKAPVFAKVAQAALAVVESDEKSSAAALLELATLVNAILYTQGETGLAGDLLPIETADLGDRQAQASARVLKPLLEALSTTGSGRLELIRDAVERDAFRDLRLVRPALAALDDPYPEIADLMADKVLPLYGKAILSELRARFDIKGKAGHLRRLRLLHNLDPAGTRDLIKQALEEGSKEMKVAAIECLGGSDEDLSYLLEQTRAKAGDVRGAALRALAALGLGGDEVVASLKKAIAGPDLALISATVQHCPLPEIHAFVLAEAQTQIAAAFKTKDKKDQGVIVAQLQMLLSCLDGRDDPKTAAFLLQCFDRAGDFASIKSTPGGKDINEQIASLMADANAATRQRLVEVQESLPSEMFASAFFAARASLPADRLFDMFAPALEAAGEKRSKKNAGDVDRAKVFVEILSNDGNHASRLGRTSKSVALPDLDPRWLDAAVNTRHLPLVQRLARPGHAGAQRLLAEEFAERSKKKDDYNVYGLLETMVRVRHPQAGDSIIAIIEQQAKSAHGYFGYWTSRLIPDLPRSEFPKFEALLPTLPDRMVDQLMESVLALKNKPE